jgi:hypothetical protein
MDAKALQSMISQLKQWKAQGVEATAFSERLQLLQLNSSEIEMVLHEWKRLCTVQKRDAGFIYAGIGGTVMLISFLLSIFLFQQGQSFMYVLYSFTFIGIGIVFKGLIDILGW